MQSVRNEYFDSFKVRKNDCACRCCRCLYAERERVSFFCFSLWARFGLSFKIVDIIRCDRYKWKNIVYFVVKEIVGEYVWFVVGI